MRWREEGTPKKEVKAEQSERREEKTRQEETTVTKAASISRRIRGIRCYRTAQETGKERNPLALAMSKSQVLTTCLLKQRKNKVEG